MQDAILIQSWFTPDYRQMIDLTRDRHAFYAKKHDTHTHTHTDNTHTQTH